MIEAREIHACVLCFRIRKREGKIPTSVTGPFRGRVVVVGVGGGGLFCTFERTTHTEQKLFSVDFPLVGGGHYNNKSVKSSHCVCLCHDEWSLYIKFQVQIMIIGI